VLSKITQVLTVSEVRKLEPKPCDFSLSLLYLVPFIQLFDEYITSMQNDDTSSEVFHNSEIKNYHPLVTMFL
jgi:hypothetical protein